MEYEAVMKQFKLNVLRLLLSEIPESREISAVILTISNSFDVGIHSDIYEPIGFQLGVMIDTTELYVLILVCVTLTRPWFKIMGMQESKNYCAKYLPKLAIDEDGIGHAVETCLSK